MLPSCFDLVVVVLVCRFEVQVLGIGHLVLFRNLGVRLLLLEKCFRVWVPVRLMVEMVVVPVVFFVSLKV